MLVTALVRMSHGSHRIMRLYANKTDSGATVSRQEKTTKLAPQQKRQGGPVIVFKESERQNCCSGQVPVRYGATD